METFLKDLRYTIRTVRRDLAFFVIAVLILGIGIGANTAIFSLVNALLLRPLPFPDSDRLVWIENNGGNRPRTAGAGGPSSLSGRTSRALTFDAWRTRNTTFEDVGGYFAFFNYGSAKLTTGDESERLVDVGVTCTFYSTLGVQPALGRLFLAEECQQNGPRAVLISHPLWERRFNADASIVGRAITLNDRPATIVGVMPASFDFGSVFVPGTRADIWSPFPIDEFHDTWGNTLAIVGRLKPGVSIQSAQAELETVTGDLQRARPERGRFYGAGIRPLQEHVSGRLRPALLLLFAAVSAVLLIVCANLSNLFLARAASRQQEIAVRTALGASRWRLIRQLLTESVALSLCGALLGLLFAVAATRGVTQLSSFDLPLLQTVHVDGLALAFTIAVALLTGLLFGLVPALQMSVIRPQEALNQNARGSTDGARTAWIRRGSSSAKLRWLAFSSSLPAY